MTFQSVGGKKAEKEPRKNKINKIKLVRLRRSNENAGAKWLREGQRPQLVLMALCCFILSSGKWHMGLGKKNTMILGLFIMRGHFLIACFLLKTADLPLRTISSGDWAFGTISPQISTCSLWDMSTSLLMLTQCFTCTCHFWSRHMIRSTLHFSFKYSWGWVTKAFSNKAEC